MKLNINRNKSQMIGLRLAEDQLKEIKAIAKKEGVNYTEIIRALVSAALEEVKRNNKSQPQ